MYWLKGFEYRGRQSKEKQGGFESLCDGTSVRVQDPKMVRPKREQRVFSFEERERRRGLSRNSR